MLKIVFILHWKTVIIIDKNYYQIHDSSIL